ncbi:MAG TPA: hypothetical protein VMX17_16500 [Candidatus Glassbacteria bacterium]|nr:hypothetical protein [Candidatus Glassbacteria bacterium]
MKIRAKNILAQQKTVQVPTEQLEKQPIVEEQEEDLYSGLGVDERQNKLEYDFTKSNLGYGDRLRITDGSGNMFDVMAMPDGTIAIQNLTLKLEYGRMTKYNTWEDANAAIPQDYEIQKAIVAKKQINPYI